MLGGKLLKEVTVGSHFSEHQIVLELADEKTRFAVFSAHDYNVLALLAALGQSYVVLISR